jgi:hypothetical protein
VCREELFERISELTGRVIADPRWDIERDDLGVSVLGMLLYGLSLAPGRIVMLLEIEDIDAPSHAV